MNLFGTIFRELKKLPSNSADARLIRFRMSCEKIEFIEEIDNPDQFRPKANPIIFVHGVDYADDREAISDFIQPLAEACGLGKSRRHSEFYLLTWNSMLFSRAAREEIGFRNLRRLVFYVWLALTLRGIRSGTLFLSPETLRSCIARNSRQTIQKKTALGTRRGKM